MLSWLSTCCVRAHLIYWLLIEHLELMVSAINDYKSIWAWMVMMISKVSYIDEAHLRTSRAEAWSKCPGPFIWASPGPFAPTAPDLADFQWFVFT
jgi:hypothetical protein